MANPEGTNSRAPRFSPSADSSASSSYGRGCWEGDCGMGACDLGLPMADNTGNACCGYCYNLLSKIKNIFLLFNSNSPAGSRTDLAGCTAGCAAGTAAAGYLWDIAGSAAGFVDPHTSASCLDRLDASGNQAVPVLKYNSR
jgi:hypothetical protein